jgi:hypothetical protein
MTMYARVATWEGGEADAIRASAADIKEQSAAGPPPGVPSTGFTVLFDAESGKTMAIALFETEEDMREGDATLNTMSPSNEGFGKRVDVSFYEVGVEIRA